MKPHKVRLCRKCKRKRWVFVTHFTKDRWQNDYRHWECSKGHRWRQIMPSLSRMDRVLKQVYLPAITRMLNAPSTLMTFLEKR